MGLLSAQSVCWQRSSFCRLQTAQARGVRSGIKVGSPEANEEGLVVILRAEDSRACLQYPLKLEGHSIPEGELPPVAARQAALAIRRPGH